MESVLSSINRNIVECKVVSDRPAEVMAFVLIETLWNVKFFYDGIWRDRPDRINRNIVECKARSYKNKRRLYTVLIETLWNVKEFWTLFSETIFPY